MIIYYRAKTANSIAPNSIIAAVLSCFNVHKIDGKESKFETAIKNLNSVIKTVIAAG